MRRTIATLALLLILLSSTARAQSAGVSAGLEAGVGLTTQEENFGGGGLLAGARVGFHLTEKTALELSVTRIAHRRDFPGSPVSVVGRSIFSGLSLKHDFTSGRVRPFVVAGIGLNNYVRTWTDPVSASRVSRGGSHGYNAGGGVVVRRGRWEHGPEARLYMLAVDADSTAAFILTGAYRVSLRF